MSREKKFERGIREGRIVVSNNPDVVKGIAKDSAPDLTGLVRCGGKIYMVSLWKRVNKGGGVSLIGDLTEKYPPIEEGKLHNLI